MTGVAGRTDYLNKCLDIAQSMASGDGEPVGVEHLLLAVMFNDDPDSRSRLALKQLGAHHFFTDETYDEVARVFARSPRPGAPWSQDAEKVLGRLVHWTVRTGDHTADTAHLLAACLESRPDELTQAGVTSRDIVRASITVRHRVSPADRQLRVRGPILSARRHNRPPSYQFVAKRQSDFGPRKPRHFNFRSQTANTTGLNSRVQFHITQLHVATLIALSLASLLMLIAIAHAALTVSWWALSWLAGQVGRRALLPISARLVIDVALIVMSIPLGLPWWLTILAVLHRGLDVFEGRLGLLELRGEAAEPRLSEKDIRADRRVNARGARFYSVLKLRRELSTR